MPVDPAQEGGAPAATPSGQKIRVMACLVVRGDIVVQSLGFKRYLPVGRPEIVAEYLNRWGVDELVLLDIEATSQDRAPEPGMVERVGAECFVPLTVGGGIARVESALRLLRLGADKVAVNTHALARPELISDISDRLGDQCVVVSIDAGCDDAGAYRVFARGGRLDTGLEPSAWAVRAQEMGAGEILINNIDRDGIGAGYDPGLIRSVASEVDIPVIALGGAGCPEHLLQGVTEGRASAVAAANYFHFSEHSVVLAKAHLAARGVAVRLDTHFDYQGAEMDPRGRLLKRPAGYLEKLRFIYQPDEVI